MEQEQIKDATENPAFLTKEAFVEPCANCGETINFVLQDKRGVFSIDLTAILECLRFAEAQSEVPKLPDEWWILIKNRYNL